MAKRRLWSSLSPKTKSNYKKHGITPAMYNGAKARKEAPELFAAAAKGKAYKSWTEQRAEAFGLGHMVRDFDKLSPAVRRQLSDAYMSGPMKVNMPLRSTESGGFEFAPIVADETSHHFGETRAFDDTVMSRMRLFELFDEIGKGDMTAEDWEIYRALYNNHF